MTVWTVYRTTHLESGKVYIGVHKTLDPNDRYLGSGKLLTRAIKKHGRQAFKKEVLFIYDNAEDAYSKEAELVHDAFVKRADSYNLMEGGAGNKYGSPGEKNSQWGSTWAFQGDEEKKFPSCDVPQGWVVGRSTSSKRRMSDSLAKAYKSGAARRTKLKPEVRLWMNRDGGRKRVLVADVEDHLNQGWFRGMTPSKEKPFKKSRWKLTREDVLEIRSLSSLGLRPLSEKFGVSQMNISKILRRITWRSV